jgi:hypothetical protein
MAMEVEGNYLVPFTELAILPLSLLSLRSNPATIHGVMPVNGGISRDPEYG